MDALPPDAFRAVVRLAVRCDPDGPPVFELAAALAATCTAARDAVRDEWTAAFGDHRAAPLLHGATRFADAFRRRLGSHDVGGWHLGAYHADEFCVHLSSDVLDPSADVALLCVRTQPTTSVHVVAVRGGTDRGEHAYLDVALGDEGSATFFHFDCARDDDAGGMALDDRIAALARTFAAAARVLGPWFAAAVVAAAPVVEISMEGAAVCTAHVVEISGAP